MLVSLLPKGSYAGVWEFGDLVNINMAYGKVNQHWLQEADNKVKELERQTRFSNLDEALRKVTEGWHGGDPSKERNIIILTGSKLRVSHKEGKNLANESRIIDELIPSLQQRDIRVYIASFADVDADQSHHKAEDQDSALSRLSAATGGRVYSIKSKESLQRAFLNIFTQVAAVDEIPIFKNAFYIDRSVEEATVLLLRKDNTKTAKPVMLKSPVGVTYSYNRHPKWIQWVKRDLFSLITLSKPLYGQWHILADYLSPMSKVLIATQLQLAVSELPKIAFAGERFQLKAKILNQGKLLKDPNLVKVIKLVSNIRMGEQSTRKIIASAKPGEAVYMMDFAAMTTVDHDPSMIEISLFADGITFEREFVQSVQVFNSPVVWKHKVVSEEQKPVYAVNISPRDDLIESDRLKLRIFAKPSEGQHEEVTLEKQANGSWMFWLPALHVGQNYQLLAHVSGVTVAKRPFGILESVYQIDGTVVPPPPVAEDDMAETSAPEERASEEQMTEETAPSEGELLGEDESSDEGVETESEESSESDFAEGDASEEAVDEAVSSSMESGSSSLVTVLFFVILIITVLVSAVLIPVIIIMRKRQKKLLQSMAEGEETEGAGKDETVNDEKEKGES
ncbi:hypothetical protein [Piscirickettsia litoralis]|uniref:hypothetical protein n=1 Tax=Piscirickettsia litoralis TaxID=1891921 RepID=UPI000AF10424|nr:hypothetical protein [Piscirickettsia litoralis]